MSGRIQPNRPGFAGFDCVGIPTISVSCVDCTFNNYLYIPVNLGGVTDSRPWKDYYPAATKLPKTWPHNCDLPYEGSFLEVEYPDVPSVSVRGIGFMSSWPTKSTIQNFKCYTWKWLDPSTLPKQSKGHMPYGAPRRWFYLWYGPNLKPHYTDDNPTPKSNIKSDWVVGSYQIDQDYYGTTLSGKVDFKYCGECPEEKYSGPFKMYLNPEVEYGENTKVYEGKIIKGDGTYIDVPEHRISVTSSGYVYYDVDEATDPLEWELQFSSDYPEKESPTDTQYYLVIGYVNIVPESKKCMFDIGSYDQIQYGDYKKGGGANNCGYFKVLAKDSTTLRVIDGNSPDATTCGYAIYNDQKIDVESLTINVTSDLYVWLEVNESGGALYGNIQLSGSAPEPEKNKFKLMISRISYADGGIKSFTQEHCGWAIVDILSIYSAINDYAEGKPMGLTITEDGDYKWIEIKKCTPAEEEI